MEEVVQTLVEEGALSGERGTYRLDTTPTELHISPTVQGVLAARIDRLTAEEKELLQQLAVIGRQFPVSLVKQAMPQSEEALYRVLSSLQAKEFVYEQPAFPEVEYLFKHALTQEVAYGTVLQERRKALHEQTAQALETLYQESLDDHYTELAYHYQQSANTEKAVEYLELAGYQAVQRSAHEEAVGHLSQGLALLSTLADTPERAQHELRLQMALGAPLMSTKGWAAPEVERTFTRAHELCQQLGETPQLFGVLAGLWVFHIVGRSAFETVRALADQLLLLAQHRNDPSLVLQAHSIMANTLFLQGDLLAARTHCEQVIGLYDPQWHRSLVSLGPDLGVINLLYAAWTLWVLGYPDQAAERNAEALRLAQELAHPFSLAQTFVWAAIFHTLRGEARAAQAEAEASLTLSRERGFGLLVTWATITQGWALAVQDHPEQGFVAAAEGLAVLRASGAEVRLPSYLALLAEMHGQAGQAEAGSACWVRP